jgi:ribonuclease P protein component
MESSYSLSKRERLTGELRIKQLFEEGESFLAYPLRIVFRRMPQQETTVRALFSVPKRRFRRANKRNLLKRRMREAYRLNQKELSEALRESPFSVDIAFSYISNEVLTFGTIERKMSEALSTLKTKTGPDTSGEGR